MLWDKYAERRFFEECLDERKVSPDKLFYRTKEGRYVAYWEKDYEGEEGETKETLQSRNSYIGDYTERWVIEKLQTIAQGFGLHLVHKVVCPPIGLSTRSPGDVGFCRTGQKQQKPEDIAMILEVKMSVVWNWEYDPVSKMVYCIGDFTTHAGRPSLLRSDTMLKAIGKSVNIRISSPAAASIPIVIVGNTPITRDYYDKVDYLKDVGIIQGFLSLNPSPLDSKTSELDIKETPRGGFLRIDNQEELESVINGFLTDKKVFFSSMKAEKELGEIIEVANLERDYEMKARKFLQLLKGGD